jgi:hypothetical protein
LETVATRHMQGARTSAGQRKTLAWNGRELVTAAGVYKELQGVGAQARQPSVVV